MLDLSGEEARLLLSIALMAIGQNRFKSAANILATLERFRPEEASVAVANAVLLMSMQDFQGAVDYIDKTGLERFPESAMLKAFKGMALKRLGLEREAFEPLKAAAEQSEDQAAAQLAKDLMT